MDEAADVSGRDREDVDRRRRRGNEPGTPNDSDRLLDTIDARDTLPLVNVDVDATRETDRDMVVLDVAADAVAVDVDEEEDCCC
jgi:hypothetical protein